MVCFAISDYDDHRNRLTTVSTFTSANVATGSVTYTYNAEDELVSRTSGGLTEYYVSENGDRVLSLSSAGSVTRRNTWGVLGELVIDEVFGGAGAGSRWAVTDHLGTVTDLINMVGNEIIEHREYDAFGAIDAAFDQSGSAVAVTNLKTPIGFTGQVFDSQTGLSYHAARWYDPGTGRFTSEDPIGEGANHYRYAGNDPVNFYDPTGLSQAGNPLNALAGGYSGGIPALENQLLRNPSAGRNASAGRSIIPVGNFNNTGYNAGPVRTTGSSFADTLAISTGSFGTTGFAGPRYTPTAQQINSLATNTNIVQQVARAPVAQPVDVNAQYLKRYGTDSSFRNAIDDYDAYSQASYLINNGTPAQAFRGQLTATLNSTVYGFVPGIGELQDTETLFSRDSSVGQRVLAGGSLAVSLLTGGASPNYGSIRVATHSFDEIADLQRLTRQIDVLPNSHVFSQIDTYGDFTIPVRGGPYGHLVDPPSANSGRNFTPAQKNKIYAENVTRNGGVLRDDRTGELLVRPQQARRGITPPNNEAQVDHVFPKSEGGPNTYSNAEVISRKNNQIKRTKIE